MNQNELLHVIEDQIHHFLGSKSEISHTGRHIGAATQTLWGQPKLSEDDWRSQTLLPLQKQLSKLGASVVSAEHIPLFEEVGSATIIRAFSLHGVFLLLTHPELQPVDQISDADYVKNFLSGFPGAWSKTRLNAQPMYESYLEVDLQRSPTAMSAALWISNWASLADSQKMNKIELRRQRARYTAAAEILKMIATPE